MALCIAQMTTGLLREVLKPTGDAATRTGHGHESPRRRRRLNAAQANQLIEPFHPKAVGVPIGLAHAAHICGPALLWLIRRGIEDAIYDNQAIHGFVGIDLNLESAPDAATLL